MNLTASVTEPEWNNHAAQVTVNVSYDDYPDTKPYQAFVSLYEIPSKIEILKAPDKTEYRLGESLDATGMEVRATYANGDTVMVNNDDLTLEAVGLNKMRVSYRGASVEQDIAIALTFSGSGTQEDPYVISTTDQIDDFAFAVNAGEGFEDKYFALGSNVTLPTDWKPAGCMIDESLKSIESGKNINPFLGTFDGKGYTLTVPEGENSVAIDGTLYSSTKKNTKGCPTVQWCSWKRGLNRTDDPLGADAGNLFGYVAPAFEVSTAVAAGETGEAAAPVRVGDTVTLNVSVAANYGVAVPACDKDRAVCHARSKAAKAFGNDDIFIQKSSFVRYGLSGNAGMIRSLQTMLNAA